MNLDDFKEKQKLENQVEKINRDCDGVIVEGYSDKHVLEELGYNGKIFLSAERTIEDLVEDVSRGVKRVAVLTDFDQHGKEQNKKITRLLDQKIDVIKSCRKDFGAQLTSTGRRTIEDAKPLLSSKEDKFTEAKLDRLYFKNQK